MRRLTWLAAAAASLAIFAGASAAHADVSQASNQVDGTIRVDTTTCSWVNASTSDNPPNPLTIDRSTVDLDCQGLASNVRLNNDPNVTFDDAAGTATVDLVSVTATVLGISCTYEARNVTATRVGTSRDYTASGFEAELVSGGFLCPGDTTDTEAYVSFH